MFKLILMSAVIVPVLVGMQAAKSRSRWRGLVLLLTLVLAFDLLYMGMLVYLRDRWLLDVEPPEHGGAMPTRSRAIATLGLPANE